MRRKIMTRLAAVLLLFLCSPATLAAQEPLVRDSAPQVQLIPAPRLLLRDSAGTAVIPPVLQVERHPLGERVLRGAMVGAVTGAVLAEQGSECAPAGSPAEAGLFGAAWGAVRSALGWPDDADARRHLHPRDGREPGPFPFDTEDCDPVASD
jgi:hypothetical protein